MPTSDLIVLLWFEFFGGGFIAVDRTRNGWEKQLTCVATKYALNERGKPEKGPHPRLAAMPDESYETLMGLIRGLTLWDAGAAMNLWHW